MPLGDRDLRICKSEARFSRMRGLSIWLKKGVFSSLWVLSAVAVFATELAKALEPVRAYSIGEWGNIFIILRNKT